MESYYQQRKAFHAYFSQLVASKICFYSHPARKQIFECLQDPTYGNFALIFCQLYSNDYLCTSINYHDLYHFTNHRWHSITCGGSYQRRIIEILINDFKEFLAEFSGPSGFVIGSSRIQARLDNRNFRYDIIREIERKIYQPNISFDQKRHLLCFENGVFDLEKGIFRNGERDDYITLTTGINYRPFELYSNPQAIREINQYMTQVFPVPQERIKMWDHLARCLHGNQNGSFQYWFGTGSNSMNTLIRIIKEIMGDYYIGLPSSLLISRRSTNVATPEIVRIKGRRIVVFQDPEEYFTARKRKLNYGVIKELVGGDQIMGRQLYRQPESFHPQANIIMTSHFTPGWKDDPSMWRRTILIPFRNYFQKGKNYDQIFTQSDNSETWISMLIDQYLLLTKKELMTKRLFPRFPPLICKIIACYY